MQDECDNDDDVKEQWAKLQRQKEAQARRRQAKLDEIRAVPMLALGAPSSASSSSERPAVPARARRFVPAPEVGRTLEEGRTYLPSCFFPCPRTQRERTVSGSGHHS